MTTPFVGPYDTVDSSLLEQQANEVLAAAFEGWAPAEGDPETWLIKAFSRIGGQIYDQATVLLTGAFQRFGESVAGVPPIQAAPAYVDSVWTMIDALGHTIPAGTQVAIAVDGDTSVGFRTVEEVVVAPAATTAAIQLEAIIPGESGNGLSADPQLIDALAFVEGITLEGVSAGGVDEEEEDAYLDRLVATLRLLSLSLIVGSDLEVDALAVPGVARAKAIEAWNGEKEEAEALCVSVFPVEADGTTCTEEAKEALLARQQAKVPSGVDVFVEDPTYQAIKVKVQFVTATGFDPEAVKAAVTARLTAYLSPATWGLPTQGDPSSNGGWENRTTVYLNELIQEVSNVSGVDRVSLLEYAKQASALGTTASVSLGTSKVMLAEAGTLTVEAV